MTRSLAVSEQTRIDGGFNAVTRFHELADIPAASFAEYLMYAHLSVRFTALRNELPPVQQAKLTIEYSPAGQLRLSWRGLPNDPRRTVLIGHVDRESFLVRLVDRASVPTRAICWHTSGDAPQSFVKGSRVRLTMVDEEMIGTIEAIDLEADVSSQQPFNHRVTVAIDKTIANEIDPILENSLFVGIGRYDFPAWEGSDGVIAAPSVDNTAGVSVIATLMTAIAKRNWKVNVDCLFTTCEEAGFYGTVAEILRGSTFDAGEFGDTICIVVDGSSHLKFYPERGIWNGSHLPTETAPEPIEIPLKRPVIRTADAAIGYHREVARLLCAAAANLEGASETRDWIPVRSTASISGTLRRILEPAGTHRAVTRSAWRTSLVGQMRGGWCEATPLILANPLRARLNLPPLNLLVGAVAIPMGNYRNSFNAELQPEKCHEDAVRGACQLLGEAVRLCHRWPFDGSAPALPAVVQTVKSAEQLIDRLLEWQEQYAGLSSITRAWVRAQAD